MATPENENTLLEFARAGSAANLERVVRGWKTLDRKSELTAEQIRHRSRRLSAWVDDDGMVVVQGRLDPEVGTLLMRAVDAASDALFRGGAEGGKGGDGYGCGNQGCGSDSHICEGQGRTREEARAELEATTPEQRRADAVGLVAERALAAGFGGGCREEAGDEGAEVGDGGDEADDEKVNPEGVRHRGNVGSSAEEPNEGLSGKEDGGASEGGADSIRTPAATPISGTRAERYQVMLHVDADTISEDGEPALSELEDGTRVSAETSRRLACDTSVVKIVRGPEGEVRGAGRRTRTVSPALRRALEARDRGCRFPGCGLRFTDAHHVKHWADGGESTLRNMVLLCRRHHRAVHEGQMDVWIDRDGQVVFFTPKGKAVLGAPTARPLTDQAAVGLDVHIQARPVNGRVDPTDEPQTPAAPSLKPLAGAPRWNRDPDIPWEVEAQAWEALDSE